MVRPTLSGYNGRIFYMLNKVMKHVAKIRISETLDQIWNSNFNSKNVRLLHVTVQNYMKAETRNIYRIENKRPRRKNTSKKKGGSML